MLRRILHDLREENAINRNRIFRDQSNPLDKYNDLELYMKYRFDRNSIMEFADLLDEDLSRSDNRNNPYPPVVQIMATLRYFASNSFQDVVAETLDASQPSLSRMVNRVAAAFAKRAKNYILYPIEEETIRKYRTKYSEMADFPQVIGCIDCTHIRVIPPKEFAQVYYNRKGFPSINVQAVCGPNGEFIDLVVKWPGSTHDGRIFRESSLREKLEDGRYSGLLLGDSGYACRPYLLTPYSDPETDNQKRFNCAQRRTRVLIEQAFGRWKRRFSILHGEVRLKLDNAFPLIVACAVLHNIAVKKRLPDLDDDDFMEDDLDNDDLGNVPDNNHVDGKALRDHFAQEFFSV